MHQETGLQIEVTQNSNDVLQVSLRTEKAVRLEDLLLDNPSRLVLDLSGIEVKRPGSFTLAANPILERLRMGRHPGSTRIVLDFKTTAPPPYRIERGARGATVILEGDRNRGAPAAEPTRTLAPVEPPRPEPHEPAAPAPADTEPRAPAAAQAAPGERVVLTPGFSVDRVYVRFPSQGRPVENFVVKSHSRSTLFLVAQCLRVMHPGQAEELRIATSELVVSPRRVTLQPDEQRTLRLLLREEPYDEELVYRVQLIPHQEDFEKQEIELRAEGDTARIPAVVGLGLLVTAEPATVRADLHWQRSGDKLVFENRGNLNVLLDRMTVCLPGAECAPLPVARLYAGNAFSLDVPATSSIEFLKRIGDDYERVVIPPGGNSRRSEH